jgi:2-C-methyl-D-erythritol 2,4-cyclodiphosphate synthase
MRIGSGYDVHKLVEGRKLIIGGVHVPHETGLLGHSDADVLVHAVMDSILGALALGDIGKHFPDTEEKYKGADSIKLLEFVYNLIKDKGYVIGNIDCTIIAQSPKMAPHIQNMRNNICKSLNTDINNINVKATTEEGLGFTGNKQGIAAQSICLLVKVDN